MPTLLEPRLAVCGPACQAAQTVRASRSVGDVVMAVLRAVQGPGAGRLFQLERESTVLGRHPDCDIVLESAAVSRRHARVFCVDGDYYVEDLHSRNGTFVNGRPVPDRQLLTNEDELGICDLSFVFHVQAPSFEGPSGAAEQEGSQPTIMMIDDGPATGGSRIMSKVDISSGSSSLQLEVNAAVKLKALTEIGQNLRKALELGEVLPSLLDSLFSIFPRADRGFVVLKEQTSGRLVPKAVKYRREEGNQTIRISRTIVNDVMTSREAILSADAASDSRFGMSESIVDFQIRSMMCAPLIDSEGSALGVIQIDSLHQRSRFNREDLDVLAAVACQAAFAVENAQLHETALKERALARELAVAHEVQRNILPTSRPQIDQYEFFEHYEPASQLGGDYYDYVPMSDGRLAVVVADVSGKGTAAALLMAKLSADTRFCLASERTPAEAIGRLNRVFCGSGWEDRFVTLVLCVLSPARNEFTLVNAGHLPPLLRRGHRPDGGPTEVEAIAELETGLPLGVDEEVGYSELTLPLQPGDCLTLYTDGITEAMNHANALYGRERLWERLRSATDGVGQIGQAILDDVRLFVGDRPQSDDMCLACFGRTDNR